MKLNAVASTNEYKKLPASVAHPAWLTWRRGDVKAVGLKNVDPGQYFGGWRSATKDKDGVEYTLPIPIVKRMSDDGSSEYEVYSTNVLHCIPIRSRLRYETFQEVNENGKDVKKLVSWSQSRVNGDGSSPHFQVFALVFDEKFSTWSYAILKFDNWSSFLSFKDASNSWNKVSVKDEDILIQSYGSVGKDGGKPNLVKNGQAVSTPIEAIGIENPIFIPAKEEFAILFEESEDWATCEMWLGGKEAPSAVLAREPAGDPFLEKFGTLAKQLRLTDVEISQILKDSGNSYESAYEAIGGDPFPTK